MKILIAGSGDTGTHLAKMLSSENQDVVLMSTDREYLAGLDSSYNIMVSVGDAVSVEDLCNSGVEDTDLFVAVTPYETINITACQLAHHLGARQCVARIENECFLDDGIAEMFARSGVSTLIYPESLVAQELYEYLSKNWMSKWIDLHDGELNMTGIKLREGSPGVGKAIKDLQLEEKYFHIAVIRRNGDLIIPRGDDFLIKNDTLFIVLKPENLERLAEVAGQERLDAKHIMIAGGGKITDLLCGMASDEYDITVIEPDKERAQMLAEKYSGITVVNAGTRELSVLKEEQIDKMDIFMALTGSDEANIVGCMVAKESGVKRTVAQIEDISYIGEAENLWIDKVVNKKLITSASIIRSVLGSDIKVGNVFSLTDAEVAEIEVHEGSKITKAPVMDLRLPKELTLGGMIRHGRGMIIEGRTELKAGDKVIVILRTGSLLKAERLFR